MLSNSITGKRTPLQAVKQVEYGRISTTNENAHAFVHTKIDLNIHKLYKLEVILGLKQIVEDRKLNILNNLEL